MKYESIIADDPDGWPELQVFQEDSEDPSVAIGLTHERQLRLWSPEVVDLRITYPTTFDAILASIKNKGIESTLLQASAQDRSVFVDRLNAIMR